MRRWAWWLTALTVGWNSLEALIAVISGLLAGSIALVGFGLDPVVEVSSALVVMPTLAWAKRKVAAGLGSVALKADAAETQLCTYLSAVVLLGLGANALLGWWWMDPIAGLFVAALAIKESREAWTSGQLCGC